MGWTGCLTCTVVSHVTAAGPTADYTGVATVTLDGDVDTSQQPAHCHHSRSAQLADYRATDACVDQCPV